MVLLNNQLQNSVANDEDTPEITSSQILFYEHCFVGYCKIIIVQNVKCAVPGGRK